MRSELTLIVLNNIAPTKPSRHGEREKFQPGKHEILCAAAGCDNIYVVQLKFMNDGDIVRANQTKTKKKIFGG